MYRDKLVATQPKMFTETFIQEGELIKEESYNVCEWLHS